MSPPSRHPAIDAWPCWSMGTVSGSMVRCCRVEPEQDVTSVEVVELDVGVGAPVAGEVDLTAGAGDHLCVDLAITPGTRLVLDVGKDVAHHGKCACRRVVLVDVGVAVGRHVISDRRIEATIFEDHTLTPLAPQLPFVVGTWIDHAFHGGAIRFPHVDQLDGRPADEGLAG